MKVKNMLLKRIKARPSKINDRVIDFVEKKFEKLAVRGKTRYVNEDWGTSRQG